jgi:AcrR family transcriptional regulator
MVQNVAVPKRRGRPRAYDPDVALRQALEAFWKGGYAGTSLDDLAEATGMNRPSLYAGFGDKRAIYLKALEHYWQRNLKAMRNTLSAPKPLRESVQNVFEGALAIYFSGSGPPRGCFAVGTATTEVVADPVIREAFIHGMRSLDDCWETRFRAARDGGELAADADPETLAGLASAVLSRMAIRARAGTPRAELAEFARKAVLTICGRP